MKKNYFLLLSILIALFNSCAIYEDVYFASDGKVKYEMLIDGSGLLAAIPNISDKMSSSKIPKDTIFLFSNLIKEKTDYVDSLPQHKKDLLHKLEPFRVSIKNDPDESQLSVTVAGEFDDAQSMTESFAAIEAINDKSDSEIDIEGAPISGLSKLKTNSVYTWNGKSMSRKSPKTADVEKSEDAEDAAMMNMLMGNGEYTVRYHFPSKVKWVSNKDAMLSEDGKTVILKTPLSSFDGNNNILDIDVELEK